MSNCKLLSFLWGHLMMLSSLHLLFNMVNPTFICLAASLMGTSKCFIISSNSRAHGFFFFFFLLLLPARGTSICWIFCTSSFFTQIADPFSIANKASPKPFSRPQWWLSSGTTTMFKGFCSTSSKSSPRGGRLKSRSRFSKSGNSFKQSCLLEYGNCCVQSWPEKPSNGGSETSVVLKSNTPLKYHSSKKKKTI